MTDLKAARDAASSEYLNEPYVFMGTEQDKLSNAFSNGFDFAIAHLCESAGEFDEEAAANYAMTHCFGPLSPKGILIQMARWQFNQMAARVGRAALFEQQCLEAVEDNNKVFEARIAELEQQLAEARAKEIKEIPMKTCVCSRRRYQVHIGSTCPT